MKIIWTKVLYYAILIVLITSVVIMAKTIHSQKKQLKWQQNTIEIQNETIYELTKKETYSYQFEVKLSVQDKSKYNIYGRNNAGTIVAPNNKIYELKIDSTSFINIKIK